MNGLKSKELLSAAKTQARMCTYEVTHLENAFICFASDQRIANDVNLDRSHDVNPGQKSLCVPQDAFEPWTHYTLD